MTAALTPEMARQLRRLHQEKMKIFHDVLADPSKVFFDVVIITSADAEQTETYESNIEYLLSAKRIPSQTKYIVYPDPPGRKVGCGGATFYVLDALLKKYGYTPDQLESLKVLLIHAGGYSKRLPNHSHCGKIFSLLPVPSPACPHSAMNMLELKLGTFAHVAQQIPEGQGGYFVTCSDDLIFYDHAHCDFSKRGFTAFGHPSPVTVGKDHGVFILKESTQEAGIQICTKFIHKAPIEKQRAEGAVIGRTVDDIDEVYTDSVYFFSGDVARTLLDLFHGPLEGKIEAEVDAYGDFLHPLGPKATQDYMTDFGNTAKKDDEAERAVLQRTRKILFDGLRKHDLYCLPLPGSRFFHVGTMQEALHHFCADEGFLTALGAGLGDCAKVPVDGVCIIESVVSKTAKLGSQDMKGSVIEFSRIGDNTVVPGGCILSGIDLPPSAAVPANTFMQTLPVNVSALPDEQKKAATSSGISGTVGFVTHILSTADDIKKGLGEDLTIFETCRVAPHLKLASNASLWTARLFPLCATAQASLQAALDIHRKLKSGEAPESWKEPKLLLSLADCVVYKALNEQTANRKKLLDEIKGGKL